MVIIFELNIFKFALTNSVAIKGVISDNNNSQKKKMLRLLLLTLTEDKIDNFSHIAAVGVYSRTLGH